MMNKTVFAHRCFWFARPILSASRLADRGGPEQKLSQLVMMPCCFMAQTTIDESIDRPAYPVVSVDVASLPLIHLPCQLRHADLQTTSRTISDINSTFVSQQLHLNGDPVAMYQCNICQPRLRNHHMLT